MKKTITFLLVVMLLSGCAVQPKKEVTLKVLYNSTGEFMRKYGKVYLAMNENIEFEIIPLDQYYKNGLSEEQYLKIIETEKPDILFGFEHYEGFVEEERLLKLDAYIQNSIDFRMDQINSNILDYLRQAGNGSIYALSPTFAGKAVFYNKTLLDQLGVEYPTDGMNWSGILELSSRISQAGDIVDYEMMSFYYKSNLFGLVMNIADTMKVQYANESGDVTFSISEWEYIINLVVESARNGGVSTQDYNSKFDPLVLSEFSKDNVAITVEYSYLLDDLRDVDFEWGVVTVPTDHSLEGFDTMKPDALFGVNRASSHIEESVNFIKYINGEKFAQLNYKSSALSALPAREEFSKQIVDVDLHAFYSIAPLTFTRVDPFSSQEQYTLFYDAANNILHDAVNNEISTAEALELLQNTLESMIMENG